MKLKGKKVVVTGGAGFIGSHIVESLVLFGARVTVYDNLSTGKLNYLDAVKKKVRFIHGDILDIKQLRLACKDVDILSHHAAQLEIFKTIDNPEFDLKINAIGTLNVLKIAKECKVEKVINASSVSVYGQATKVPQKETDATNPNWAYGVGKLAAEKYCQIFHEDYRIPIVSLRYGQVYGVREWFGRALSVFIKRLFDKEPIVIFGDGKQMRDYIYVSDVVRCHNTCLTNDHITSGVFNVGSGRGVTILEIAQTVKAAFGDTSKIVFEDTKEGEISKLVPYRRRLPGELRKMYMSIEKAKKILRWRPAVSFVEGIQREVAWIKKNPSAWKIKGVAEI